MGIQAPVPLACLARALTAVPSGLQCEKGAASFQVIKNSVTRTKGGHNMGRLGAGEGH